MQGRRVAPQWEHRAERNRPGPLYPFPGTWPPGPLLGTDNSAHPAHPQARLPVTSKDHSHPSIHSRPQRCLGLVPQAKAHPEGCPTAAQLGPRAELLPFLPTSIQRNRGHATSTVCPSAEDGQQLVLSHSPLQPAEKSSSIRQRLNVDTGPPPHSLAHPQHLCLVSPTPSLPRIIWSQCNTKLNLW